MHRGFWDKLPRPFFALAPMYDVTDVAFRQTVIECGSFDGAQSRPEGTRTGGRPHVFFTEFTSSDGLTSVGRNKLIHHLWFEQNERPIVAQIFGAHPEKFLETAKLIKDLGFDGVDINMGCPKKAEMKGGACAALFKNPKLAQEIILATKEGSGDLPVSIKIRIGDTKVDWQNWIASLLKVEPANISIHLRTRKEMSKVPAHWELFPEIVKFIRENTTADTRPLIVGNGDVISLAQAREYVTQSGCDGIMVGRGIFQNPWIFNESVNPDTISPTDRAKILLSHARRFEQKFGTTKRFDILKRFFKIYITDFPGVAEIRDELYRTTSVNEAQAILLKHKLV